MGVFADASTGKALAEHLNASSEFETYARWFDGSILLESEDGQCWLKVYRGKVIDQLPFMPPLGYTFKLGGPDWAWMALIQRERHFVDLITPGRRHFDDDDDFSKIDQLAPPALRLEGNVMEAGRVTEAVHLLAEACAAVLR
jgi:hypothetical protein